VTCLPSAREAFIICERGIISIEEAKQFLSPNPLVLVTLQKGSSTAGCMFGLANWQVQLAQSLESPTQCHTYPPQ